MTTSISFPEPTAKRYAHTKTSLGKAVVQSMYKSNHKAPAKDWAECYAWVKQIALSKGWTTVAQTKTRVILEVNQDLNFRQAQT